MNKFTCILPESHTHTHTHTHIHAQTHTYTLIFTQIHSHTHTYTHLYIYPTHTYSHIPRAVAERQRNSLGERKQPGERLLWKGQQTQKRYDAQQSVEHPPVHRGCILKRMGLNIENGTCRNKCAFEHERRAPPSHHTRSPFNIRWLNSKR